MFQKLYSDLPELDLSKLKGQEYITFENSKTYYVADLNYLLEKITKIFQFSVDPDFIGYTEINGSTAIHKDPDPTVLIWFLEEVNCTFYDIVQSNPTDGEMQNVFGDNINISFYKRSDLKLDTHVRFESNQMVLLDNSQPHAMIRTSTTGDTIRFIKFSWSNAYDQVLASFT